MAVARLCWSSRRSKVVSAQAGRTSGGVPMVVRIGRPSRWIVASVAALLAGAALGGSAGAVPRQASSVWNSDHGACLDRLCGGQRRSGRPRAVRAARCRRHGEWHRHPQDFSRPRGRYDLFRASPADPRRPASRPERAGVDRRDRGRAVPAGVGLDCVRDADVALNELFGESAEDAVVSNDRGLPRERARADEAAPRPRCASGAVRPRRSEHRWRCG